MPLFDILAALVLFFSLIYSAIRGMVREIFALLAYIGGYFAAINFRKDFSATLSPYISNPTASEIVSFALIFIVTVVAVSLLGRGIRNLVHLTPGLSGLDRFFGSLIGLVRGVIILVILMFPLSFFPDLNKEITKNSIFAPKLFELSKILGREMDADKIIDKIPSFDLDKAKDKLRKLKGAINLPDSLKSGEEEEQIFKGKPQESHTKDDKKKLNDILISLDKN